MQFGCLNCCYKEPFPVNTDLQTCVSFVTIRSPSMTKYNYRNSHLEWLVNKLLFVDYCIVVIVVIIVVVIIFCLSLCCTKLESLCHNSA